MSVRDGGVEGARGARWVRCVAGRRRSRVGLEPGAGRKCGAVQRAGFGGAAEVRRRKGRRVVRWVGQGGCPFRLGGVVGPA